MQTHTHTHRVNHQLQEATDKVATLEKQLQRYVHVIRPLGTRLVQCTVCLTGQRKNLSTGSCTVQICIRWSLTSLHAHCIPLSSPSPIPIDASQHRVGLVHNLAILAEFLANRLLQNETSPVKLSVNSLLPHWIHAVLLMNCLAQDLVFFPLPGPVILVIICLVPQ